MILCVISCRIFILLHVRFMLSGVISCLGLTQSSVVCRSSQGGSGGAGWQCHASHGGTRKTQHPGNPSTQHHTPLCYPQWVSQQSAAKRSALGCAVCRSVFTLSLCSIFQHYNLCVCVLAMLLSHYTQHLGFFFYK